jgi:predicted secreted hydrolase
LQKNQRRLWLQGVIAGASASITRRAIAQEKTAATQFQAVVADYKIEFPRDHGAHSQFRTEWWYITAWLKTPDSKPLGMQITFFRTATGASPNNVSRFAPKQILFAHLAIADPSSNKLYHDQQSARSGIKSFSVSDTDTHIQMRQWTLKREADDSYSAQANSIYLPPEQSIGVNLRFVPNQAPLLQGREGFSRKGPNPEQASYYYSRPQMAASGQIQLGSRQLQVTGNAWLDHEWSTSLLDDQTTGWDWIGINLNDGASLMAFQLRNKENQCVWSYVVLRDAQGKIVHAANEVTAARFTPKRYWKSLESGANYPVAQTLRCGQYEWQLEPLFDSQEIDARASTGGFYWEGAVRLNQMPSSGGVLEVGKGYLEMTGYSGKIKLS